MALQAHIEYERNARRRVAEYDEQKAKRLALSGSLQNHGARLLARGMQAYINDRSLPPPTLPDWYVGSLNRNPFIGPIDGIPISELPIPRVNRGGKAGPMFPVPPRRDYEDIANLRRNWMTLWPWLRNLPADIRESIAYRVFGEDEERLWGITDREFRRNFTDPKATAIIKERRTGGGPTQSWMIRATDYPSRAFGVINNVREVDRALADRDFAGTEGGQVALFPPRDTPRFVSPVERYLYYDRSLAFKAPFEPPQAPLYPAPFDRPAPGGFKSFMKRFSRPAVPKRQVGWRDDPGHGRPAHTMLEYPTPEAIEFNLSLGST